MQPAVPTADSTDPGGDAGAAAGTSRSRARAHAGRREGRPVGRRRTDRRRTGPAEPAIGNWGAWETSGIVDASAAFGPGAFLIDVQAHTLWVEKDAGPDTFIGTDTVPGDPDFTYKREGGQLLLIRIPGI